MSPRKFFLFALLLGSPIVACDGGTDSVVGRWERTRQPREWIEFDSNGTFMGRPYLSSDSSLIRGTYTQEGATVTMTGNYTRTLTLRDSSLVMEDGTEYRRASRP